MTNKETSPEQNTPGPWQSVVHNWWKCSVMASDKQVCLIQIYDTDSLKDDDVEREQQIMFANAKLIARAPEMAAEISSLKVENEKLRERNLEVTAALSILHTKLLVVHKPYNGSTHYDVTKSILSHE